MNIQKRIKELSELSSSSTPILSLYLNYSHREAREVERLRIFLKNIGKEIDTRDDGKELAGDLKEIQAFLESSVEPTTHGLAFFRCGPIGLATTIQTWIPMRAQWSLSSSPNVRQLARLVDDFENTLAVVVNSEKGRIIRITPEAHAEEVLVTEGFPGRHEQGGWSQGRYQRHIEEHLMRHLKRVAEEVVKTWDAHHFTNAVIVGQDHLAAQFQKLLPKRILDSLEGILTGDIQDPISTIVTSVVHLIREVEERRAHEELEQLASSGKLVKGWEQVIPAINQSRLSTLYLKAGDSRPGWQCAHCDVIGEKPPLGCPICGESVSTCDLVDAAVTKAEREGTRVEICMTLDEVEVAGRPRS